MRAAGPGQPAHLLLDIVDILTQLSIPYTVVGAFAVSFHGIPRSTNDADAAIWLQGTGKTERDVVNGVVGAGLQAQFKSGDIDDPISGVIFVRDKYENRVDLLLGIRGMDSGALQRSLETLLLNEKVKMISAEDLIAMKTFAGGVQDLSDVSGILQVSRGQLNVDLLRTLCDAYGRDVRLAIDKLLNDLPRS